MQSSVSSIVFMKGPAFVFLSKDRITLQTRREGKPESDKDKTLGRFFFKNITIA